MSMELSEWLVLVLLTLVAIGGLLFASGATGPESSIGLLVAVAAVVGVFYRVKQYFDRVDASRH